MAGDESEQAPSGDAAGDAAAPDVPTSVDYSARAASDSSKRTPSASQIPKIPLGSLDLLMNKTWDKLKQSPLGGLIFGSTGDQALDREFLVW
jgi:hypothetical protein